MGVIQLRKRLNWLFIGVVLILGTLPAQARYQTVIENNAVADSLFSVGLERFTEGDYAASQATFDRLINEFRPNRSTTASVVFAAKSAYRQKKYESVRSYLNGFAITYASSSYLDEAKRLDELALGALQIETANVVDIGVILSLDRDERQQTQEIFNGIRLAIDEHNKNSPNKPIRLVFRDIDGGATAARKAVRELAGAKVVAILGTLFSEEALAAADEANKLSTVFVAPLATDDEITQGKPFAFQANPSMKTRGAAMARFVKNGLRLDNVAVVLATDERKISERQADGFLTVASELGLTITMVNVLPSENSLYSLADTLPSDTLNQSDVIYMPLASRRPVATVGAILSNLDRMNRNIRVIGNEGWEDLPQKTHASAYLATYGSAYWVDPANDSFAVFSRSYRALAGKAPDKLAVTGYDVTRFVLKAINEAGSGAITQKMRDMDPFDGLGIRIHFDGQNINQALFYHRYRDNQLTLIK